VVSEHLVHFFDDTRARVDTVSAFLADALSRNGAALVVARPTHWTEIAGVLDEQGLITEQGPRLVVLDARTTLTLLMRGGRIDPERFRAIMAPLLADLSTSAGRPVTIYGEMVDLLASEGHFEAVDDLERCWNTLLAREPGSLLCGYSSAHFAVVDRTHLASVCSAHTRVHTGGADTLGGWLVKTFS
jgi:hypothetical protein